MRLLMTRPEPDASLSAERLQALGHTVIVSPVLEIIFSPEALLWCSGVDLVVTSRNGMRALADLGDDAMRSDAAIFTVGDATAALAKEAGFLRVFSASGTVDDLVRLITTKNPAQLLYICGRERKGDLEGKLRACGISVDLAERYHANFASQFSAQAISALKEQSIDGVLFYSTRSAEAFNQLMERQLISYSTKQMVYFCLAKTVSYVFDNDMSVHTIVSGSPDEQSLFDAIDAYAKNC